MFPFGNPMLADPGAAVFVGQSTSTAPGTITYPTGTAVGDLAIVFCGSGGTISGWETDTQGALRMSYRALAAADLSAPASVSGGSQFAVVVYRGAVRAEKRTGVTSAAVPPVVIPGFARQSGRGLVLAHLHSANNGSGVVPTGWTRRVNGLGDGGFTTLTTADLLDPAAYTNNSSITINNSGPSAGGSAIVVELI